MQDNISIELKVEGIADIEYMDKSEVMIKEGSIDNFK